MLEDSNKRATIKGFTKNLKKRAMHVFVVPIRLV